MTENRSPKTVLFVSHSGGLAGAERSLLELVCSLGQRHWAPVVVIPYGGPLEEALARESIPFFKIPYMWWITRPSKLLLRSRLTAAVVHLIVNYAAAAIITWRFRTANVGLVYSNTIVCPVGALVARRLAVPHLWHVREFVHEDISADYALGTVRSMALVRQTGNRVVCNSKAVHDKMARYLEPSVLQVIYNGVLADDDNDVGHKRHPPTGNELDLCIVGTVAPGKRQEDAINAVGILARRGIPAVLHVVGTGTRDYADFLHELARSNGVEGSIRFEGYVPDPSRFYATADIALVCSRFEAFGRVAVEALATGTPVIAADAGGILEVIRDGETGLLYPVGDAGALANRIEALRASPDLWRQLSTHGRESVYDRFTRRRYIEEMTAVIGELIGDEREEPI